MNVSGIRPNQGFYQYNSIRLNELRNQQIAASSANLSDNAAKEQEKEVAYDRAAIASKQTFDSYDFAQQYRPDEEYNLKGNESDIKNLDTAKAVSELDKDQILQQYQYFVGKEPEVQPKPVAPETRAQENFFL